jgi:hypothetical protein
MTLFAFLAPHRRLLGIGLLSLLLHLLALAWIDMRAQPPAPGAAPALAVRLVQPGAAGKAPPSPPAPESASTSETTSRPSRVNAEHPPAPRVAATPRVAGQSPAPTASESASESESESATAMPEQQRAALPVAMPGQYRVRPAPAARIDYRVTVSRAGATPRDDGSARLDWRSDGMRYRITLDGVLGGLESEGGLDDAGIAPERVLEAQGTGKASTRFDRRGRAIVAGVGAASYPLAAGSQDSASLLLQLAGMGMADPDQLQEVVEFWVGGIAGARIERYQVMGTESVDTGIGALETLRLLRLDPLDSAQLELWLAPQQAWLPVQLRLTQPDGAVRTQTLATIEIAAAPGE